MSKYASTIYILLLSMYTPIGVSGQDTAFETLTLGLNVSQSTTDELFQKFWRPSRTLGFTAYTPFYFGTIQVEVRPTYFSSRDQTQKDFVSVFALLRWNYHFSFTNSLSWYGGVSVGDLFMRFQDEINPNESEFVLGYQIGLGFQINSHISSCLQFSQEQVKTYHPIKLKDISIGLHYSFQTPSLILKFLDP